MTVSAADPAAPLEATIAAIVARCLRTCETAGSAVPAVDPGTPFALLGLDSLGAIEVAVALEHTLGFDVPPDLLTECTDVRSLAARLREAPRGASADDEFDLMMADAVLPDDVQPRAGGGMSACGGLEDARAILVTGATGFLGAALVTQLLARTPATLYCLVRPGATDAPARLRRCLRERGVDAVAFDSRVQVVEGDLGQTRLGLSHAAYAALAATLDAICHAGAAVNWVCSYSALRSANVTGTLELLRLAASRAMPFHFISSLSVCYSTSAPADVDETFDPLPHLRGVHLGYAQTKIVAEALVRQAGARGLPFTICRPAIISGDSRSGAFNPDDVLAALIKGCVHMRTAPDLDWSLDCQPVDIVAAAIVGISRHAGGTFHLKHHRPRHWRECVLWMRLYGYSVQLVSYHVWLRQLQQETGSSCSEGHPLRALRSFFLERPSAAGGLTLPELYEDGRRTFAREDRTRDDVEAAGVVCPELDAALLDRYFAAYVASGHLPPKLQRRRKAEATRDLFTPAFFQRALGDQVRVDSVEALGSGSDHSIISELASWRSGGPSGLFRFRLGLETAGGVAVRDVIVKVKPPDHQVIEVGEALARVCGDRIGDAYALWAHRTGLVASHVRELAVYAQTDPRFTRHSPAVWGAVSDERAARWVLVLERVTDGLLMDSVDRPHEWSREYINRAIVGLSALHAIWYDREAELTEVPWIGHVATSASMAEMTDLWSATAEHAAPAFCSWADPTMASTHQRLIGTIQHWWKDIDSGPRTLIHHDFNPRNICLRQREGALRLCAFDWELATIGAPQRDLAELLCFVLPPDVSGREIAFWIERHRRALARETGRSIDAGLWRRGFRASVYDLLINRLAMYALVHRVKRQSFLPRVVRTWRRLYEHVRQEGIE